MTASLRAMLAGIIDYAGLFPPAQLPLDQAIRNYLGYSKDPERWLLGRFVIPAARLKELEPHLNESQFAHARFPYSALGTPGNGCRELCDNMTQDMAAIVEFRKRNNEQELVVDSYEVRLPAELATEFRIAQQTVELTEELVLGTLVKCARALRHCNVACFYEAGPKQQRAEIIAAFSRLGDDNLDRFGPVGFKLRCGGLEANAFPTPEQVAFVIATCRDAGVPLKFTAGLHHPIRHYDPGVQTKMHGFLNVFAAGVLAHARNLGEQQIRLIIEGEDPKSFVFTDEGFRWRDIAASVAEIEAARQVAVTSFGSCSFDEPRADLRALGLLP